jgi:Flp pilus assembly protein TadB
VTAEHIRSADDLHDCLVLFSSRAQNSLDSEHWRSGDVDAFQQIPQSASGDRGFISKSLDLVGIMERLVLLGVAPKSVVFIIFAFCLVALFFFLLIVFFLPMIVVVVVVRRQLLSFLRVFSYRYCDHNLKEVLPLRNVLRGVGLRLWQRWHIPRC